MIYSHYNQQSSQGFSFSMQTSSGDKISLSAQHSSEISLEHYRDESLEATALSLKESYGYSFSYEGNGIDAQDKKEIAKAMEKIKPLLAFMNPQNDTDKSDKNILNIASDINALLPKSHESNMSNYLKDSLVETMDEMLKAFKANDETLALAKKVFDALETQMEGLNLYA